MDRKEIERPHNAVGANEKACTSDQEARERRRRDDDLLKVSGVWVSTLENENVPLEHASVAEVCDVGCEDEKKLVKPFAFVVLKAGSKGDDKLASTLKEHVK